VKSALRSLRLFVVVVLAVAAFVAFPLAFPKPLFAYSVERGSLSIHSDEPIPAGEGERVLAEIEERLARSPLAEFDAPLALYVANSAWRRAWIWIVAPGNAGGFIAAPATRGHAFLSGADFESDELIAPSGFRTQPPRTLAYYGAHELTHVQTVRALGVVRFHLAPAWVREGLADYVGMPPESAAELHASIGTRDADLEMMRAYGVYAPWRLIVTGLLEEAGWSIEDLLASRVGADEARRVALDSLRSSRGAR